ncbi:MAG: acylphosphatase [Parcubacteria group bacterium LiPW_39]|nr:MAG: acylphosphatase [Parcubacteria group bacterium LiPW_39]
MKRAVIKIFGSVQGVFFRANAAAKARELGLTGWVRNERDGTVLVVAEGEQERLKKLVDWCYNRQGGRDENKFSSRYNGIGFAKVEKVEVEWEEASGEFRNFEIKYD